LEYKFYNCIKLYELYKTTFYQPFIDFYY